MLAADRSCAVTVRRPDRRRGGDEEARRDCQDEPRQRILEESAVGERVDEERDERSTQGQPEGQVLPPHLLNRPYRPRKRSRVKQEPDEAELGCDGQGRRVGDEGLVSCGAPGEPAARRGLAADPCAGTGRSTIARAASSIRVERPLVDATGRFVPCIRCHREAVTATSATATTASAIRGRLGMLTIRRASTATKRATMLDCEYVNRSPALRSTEAAHAHVELLQQHRRDEDIAANEIVRLSRRELPAGRYQLQAYLTGENPPICPGSTPALVIVARR